MDRLYEKDFLLNKLYEIKRLSEDSLFDNSLPIQNIQNLIMAARKYNFHAVLYQILYIFCKKARIFNIRDELPALADKDQPSVMSSYPAFCCRKILRTADSTVILSVC